MLVLLIFYVSIALGFSFLCSLLEASLLSVSPSVVYTAKQKGESWAIKMSTLKEDVDKPLSAILTLNTIAHTMGAAGAGAEYAKYSNNQGEAIFAGVLTFAILIFTEIIPKTLGAKFSSFFAKPTAHFLPFLQTILGPVVWFCGFITKMITLGGVHGQAEHREVLLAAAAMGEEEGQLAGEEVAVVKNVLKLSQMSARDIMTPRSVLFMVPSSITLDDFLETISDKPFSRIPVYGENRDDITGVIIRSEVLMRALRDDEWSLETSRRDIIRTQADVPLDELMRTFLKEGHHITLVTDSFGTVTGLLTLEDILETVVGVEIMDESDQVADLQEVARQLWKTRAEKMGLDTDAATESTEKATAESTDCD